MLTPPLSKNLSGVAKRICELGDWNVSNLRLQKLLYICHMIHLGRTGRPLIEENFEAWMYGPVVPQLYKKLKAYGAEPISDRFYNAETISHETDQIIQDVCGKMKQFSDSRLVAITHVDFGGWGKNYNPDVRGSIIPNDDILNEYRARQQ